MNRENFQTNIDELARMIFDQVLQEQPYFRTDYEKKVSDYRDKLYKEFMAGLTEQQKQVYDQLETLLIDEMSIEGNKQFLYGMQIHLAIERLYADPKTIIESFYKNSEVTIEHSKPRTSDANP